ncbi:formylmethanofuran dehydrogenase [Ancylobacter amanitiformis]|uniref:Formylmethanofuran dehydrogenase subunit B n=1 Tax=Ancylobacter amanitiformis TaxID=217069 RepID=A0ABU0LMF0_9HYPH|nr:formylmethanofuran dehydrogenase [Ancylobacter amanitiformis]MDQ0509788.1 formylmethanofuran dehydrogenase subunit B [Ancylobacter amanitiformis]
MADVAIETIEDVVCGFCGLGCDDLRVEVEGRALRAAGTICPEAARLIRRLDVADRPASVAGTAVDLDTAAEAARHILLGARATLIGGLGTDMAGAGALTDLAIRFGGVLDHHASDGLFRNYASVQRTGWLATTLAEVRNRCDLLLVIGEDPAGQWGRLFERLFPEAPLFAEGRRRVVFIGGAPGETARRQLGHADISHLATDDPVAVLEALGALSAGRTPPGEAFGGVPATELAALAEAMGAAHYVVATWNAAAHDDGDLVAERATALVDRLNVTTRAGVFPLGGRDNIIGVNQLLLWRLGYPLRTAVRGQASAHDGALYATEAALGDADVLLWVSAFRPEPPPSFAGKIIALAHPETIFDKEPDVLIPVGTPGIDHAGTVFRMDSIVSLPLGALRVATLPSVAEAVRCIAEG